MQERVGKAGMLEEELQNQIDELQKYRRKLTKQVDEVDTQIVGVKEELRKLRIKKYGKG